MKAFFQGLAAARRGLTGRGRSMIAAAVAAALAAYLFGQHELLRVSVLLLALPLLAMGLVSASRFRLALGRDVSPTRVAAGGNAVMHLVLENRGRVSTGTLLAEDRTPAGVGRSPRFVLDRLPASSRRSVAVRLRPGTRGRYELGPLTLRLRDPFGLVELTRSFNATTMLTVTPLVVPLPPVPLGGIWSGRGESRARAVAAAGEDDISAREYRIGDELRRVDWRATARTGQIMVRQEEQPWQSRATVLLDSRVKAHHGDGPANSVEWAVSAAASVGVALLRQGYAVRLLSEAGSLMEAHDIDLGNVPGLGGELEGRMLDALAVLTPSTDGRPLGSSPGWRRSAEGLLVTVLGAVNPAEVDMVARLREGAATGIALVLDTPSWSPTPVPDYLTAARVPAEEAAALLAARGWRAVVVRHGDQLEALWPLAGRRDGVAMSASALGGGALGGGVSSPPADMPVAP